CARGTGDWYFDVW
nr:immunoglobulin heavy chain junction region [Mus musculus]MBK4186390.1 immunoglobulin heavy chain junction region [Mus musculus]